MKKNLVLIPLMLCAICFSMLSAANIQADLSKNLLRLHVIANSNSDFDQNTKLLVRDAILTNITKNVNSYDMENIANNVLFENGISYSAKAEIEKRHIPKKEYKNIVLPEGVYNSLNVILGDGLGENWWCIAYPPLCFTESVIGEISQDGEKILLENLDKKTFDTIIKNGDVNFRFKFLDIFQKIRCGI